MWLLCFLCCYPGIFLSHAQEERGYHETRVVCRHGVKNTCVTGLKISRLSRVYKAGGNILFCGIMKVMKMYYLSTAERKVIEK